MRKNEKNNFQDKTEIKEYGKGERAGENTSKNSKPSRSNSRTRRRTKDKDQSGKRTSSAVIDGGHGNSNDISWHYIDQNMFDGATGVTFNQAVGLPIVVAPGSGNRISGWHSDDIPSPGIFTSYFIPTLGKAEDGRSPLNVAAVRLFQYLRRDKSGKEIYQPGDLAIHIGAMDSGYMFYEFMCKIYGMSQNVDLVNWYTPKTLLEAHGINFESVNRNLANFKFYIDYYATKLAGLYIPEGIRLFDRHNYMVRGLFTDSTTAKAQYYAFVPSHLWKFVEGTADSPAGSLELVQITSPATFDNNGFLKEDQLVTVEQLMEIGDMLLAPLLDSETVRNINADLMTAFPGNKCYSVGRIPVDYRVTPTYDEQYLMQLENAFYYGYDTTAQGKYLQHVELNNSYVYSTFALSPNVQFPSHPNSVYPWSTVQRTRIPLNFHKDTVTKDDIMYASRFAGFGFEAPVGGGNSPIGDQELKTHGSEIFTNYSVLFFKYEQASNPYSKRRTSGYTGETYEFASLGTVYKSEANDLYLPVSSIKASVTTLLRKDALFSMFDWHPKIYTVQYVNHASGIALDQELFVHAPKFDMDNWALIDEEKLKMLNLVSLLGLLVCRDLGYYSQK